MSRDFWQFCHAVLFGSLGVPSCCCNRHQTVATSTTLLYEAELSCLLCSLQRQRKAQSEGCSANDGVHAASLQFSIASNMSLSGSFFFDSRGVEPLSGQAHDICGGAGGAAGAFRSAPATTEVSCCVCTSRCVFL